MLAEKSADIPGILELCSSNWKAVLMLAEESPGIAGILELCSNNWKVVLMFAEVDIDIVVILELDWSNEKLVLMIAEESPGIAGILELDLNNGRVVAEVNVGIVQHGKIVDVLFFGLIFVLVVEQLVVQVLDDDELQNIELNTLPNQLVHQLLDKQVLITCFRFLLIV